MNSYLSCIIARIGGMLFFYLFVFSPPAQSQSTLPEVSATKAIERPLLSPIFLANNCSESSYAILVEKKSQKLYLYKLGKEISLEKTYFCSTGQRDGKKREQGDFKTPEGMYFFTEILEGERLPTRYGLKAFVMDYPNHFDLLEEHNGYGIWLHATNETNRALLPNDTKGCVVVQNEDLAELSGYIKLFETPIVVIDEIMYEDPEWTVKLTKTIHDFIRGWETCWENKDLSQYMNQYSRRFNSKKMNWHQWRRYKRNLNRTRKWIKVEIEDLKIVRFNQTVIVTFTQRYSSDSLSDVGVKSLYIWQENENWKIVGEKWKSKEDILALEENKKDSAHGRK